MYFQNWLHVKSEWQKNSFKGSKLCTSFFSTVSSSDRFLRLICILHSKGIDGVEPFNFKGRKEQDDYNAAARMIYSQLVTGCQS